MIVVGSLSDRLYGTFSINRPTHEPVFIRVRAGSLALFAGMQRQRGLSSVWGFLVFMPVPKNFFLREFRGLLPLCKVKLSCCPLQDSPGGSQPLPGPFEAGLASGNALLQPQHAFGERLHSGDSSIFDNTYFADSGGAACSPTTYEAGAGQIRRSSRQRKRSSYVPTESDEDWVSVHVYAYQRH